MFPTKTLYRKTQLPAIRKQRQMETYNKQIQRIKNKLLEAKRADNKLKVFGAKSHKYYLNPPATPFEVSEFERKFSIELPECYTAFITQVGNGGTGHADSAAGPFYGIYPVGKNTDELIYDNTEKYLKNDCMIYPKMTDEYWESLTKNIRDNDDISDEDYEKEIGKIYAGILPIGSQGCTYLHGIVLNGQHKGRIVNLDVDYQKPKFAFEKNFLDWYERWLDEVISGELIKETPSWFGYCKGGTEEELWTAYISSTDLDEKKDCFFGLLNKNKLKEETLNQIEKLIDTDTDHKNILIQLICKSDYGKAKKHLIGLIETDLLSIFQSVYWYAKDKSAEWLEVIGSNIQRIEDSETFRFCTYLLTETKEDFGKLILPFTKNSNKDIRITAFYTLGKLKNKKSYMDTFIEGLHDHSNRVVHTTLQALSGVKAGRLLEHYKILAEKFPVEQDYILVNLNHRLAEYGLTNQTILNKNVAITTENVAKKKWYEIWK